MKQSAETRDLPLLPLSGTVLFPHQMMPLAIKHEPTVAAVEAALATEDKTLVVVSRTDNGVATPDFEQLFPIGTVAVIKKMARVDDMIQIIVQGIERVRLLESVASDSFLKARVETLPTPEDWDTEVEAIHREVLDLAGRVLEQVNPQARAGIAQMVEQVEMPIRQVYVLSSLLSLRLEDEQHLLAVSSQLEGLRLMQGFLTHELQVLDVRRKIADQAQTEMSREQREYLLRKQLDAIQDELGEKSPEKADIDELSARLDQARLPDEVRNEVTRELSRLQRLPTASPDYQVTRSYLELIAELPWNTTTEDTIDLPSAKEILDRDHFGLEQVKERILEHLAVMKMNPTADSPILCFVGPPGVGKTSLGQSIAEAIGRKFARESLGGLSDESELRGHRRTYIGAMPGRIIQAIRRAGVRNPLLMLDEIDKLGRDFRGDPSAALLEILDPAQNHQFRDNYLNLPFDLSSVFFIATANTLDTIPRPLLDRIEVLQVSGYSDEQKRQIAIRYLLPRQLHNAGLTEAQLQLTDDALVTVIRSYTWESGVRELERVLAKICRKAARQFAEGSTESLVIDAERLRVMLGSPRFHRQDARQRLEPGVAAGLAWTPVGGDVLYVEAVLLPDGEREFTMTGQLGDVMKESARTAQSYIRSQWAELDLEKQALACGVHLHVPAGATPKDGPSAGVAIATALASLYSHQPVRSDTAMTGEITLSGLVLPVGGVREKVLAAHRAGLKQVVLPKGNQGDVEELPESVRSALKFVFAEKVEDVVTSAIPSLANRFAPT